MLGHYFTNDHITKYTVIFGSLFNDIYIKRDNSAGAQAQKIKVPIGYGPTEKVLSRMKEQPNLEEPMSAITLPRISFEMVYLQYDPDRKLNSLGKISLGSDYVYNPVPYNIYFNLYVLTKNTTDGLRIVEQILPHFTPSFNVPSKVLESMGITSDVFITLQQIQQQDSYEGSYEERRTIIWTLQFCLKGYLYGPTNTGKLIKHVEARLFDGLDQTDKIESIIVTGGQTANNVATTTRPPSIPWQDVDPDGNWDFIVEIIQDL